VASAQENRDARDRPFMVTIGAEFNQEQPTLRGRKATDLVDMRGGAGQKYLDLVMVPNS
jgi:hypothetical protein